MYGTIGKVLSYGIHMPNMKALSLKVKSYKQTESVKDGQTDRQTDRRTDDGQSDP